MRKDMQLECLHRTQELLEAWWEKNPDPFVEAMDEDIMWIASGKEEYYYGREECVKHCVRLEDLPRVYLLGQEYSVVHSDKDTCVVAGRYVANTAPGEAMVLSETQRVTFVWKLREEGLRIVHLHLSNALHILEDGEDFPRKAGLETAAYLERLMEGWTGGNTLAVMCAGRREYVVPLMDVLYVEANGECCRVYTRDGCFSSVESFKSVTERLDESFFQIHRKIVVNLERVRLVEPGSVTLFQGTKLPVAKRRMRAFRERIRAVR